MLVASRSINYYCVEPSHLTSLIKNTLTNYLPNNLLKQLLWLNLHCTSLNLKKVENQHLMCSDESHTQHPNLKNRMSRKVKILSLVPPMPSGFRASYKMVMYFNNSDRPLQEAIKYYTVIQDKIQTGINQIVKSQYTNNVVYGNNSPVH